MREPLTEGEALLGLVISLAVLVGGLIALYVRERRRSR